MFYIVIGIVVFVAVGAFIQRSLSTSDPVEEKSEPCDDQISAVVNDTADVADAVILTSPRDSQKPQKEVLPASAENEQVAAEPASDPSILDTSLVTPEPLKPVLAAEPISSPNALSSATYSSLAPYPLAAESPYAYGNTLEEEKPKAENTLLRWSGKAGTIEVGDLTLRGPIAYWSNGPCSTPEPSCIDITLPVEYPKEEQDLPTEGASSYQEMSPLQRGIYLLWLAGGRIQPPSHICYPALWLFGLERRVLADKLDISICIGEAFRLLPLIRWEPLQKNLIKFVTWMAAKVWMPEDQLLTFCRMLPRIPEEILNMLLRPYADAKLPLPSLIVFLILRASSIAGEQKDPIPDTEEIFTKFSSRYKSICQGGVVLTKPKSSIFVAYVPSNPSLAGDKNAVGGVLELPDFFKDLTDFSPLITLWHDFTKSILPTPPLSPAEQIAERPNWHQFITDLRGGELDETDDAALTSPLFTTLGALSDLMHADLKTSEKMPDEDKPSSQQKGLAAGDRKKISETAQVEGFLVIPNLGISGKEYQRDDPVALVPLEMGARPSQHYNAASLLLEFASSFLEKSQNKTDNLETLKEHLNDYFSLSSDDRSRLEALSVILLTQLNEPENIGECLQFWIQRDQRAIIRDFISDFLSPILPKEAENQVKSRLSLVLDLNNNPPPPVEKKHLELGEEVVKVLAPLFKD